MSHSDEPNVEISKLPDGTKVTVLLPSDDEIIDLWDELDD